MPLGPVFRVVEIAGSLERLRPCPTWSKRSISRTDSCWPLRAAEIAPTGLPPRSQRGSPLGGTQLHHQRGYPHGAAAQMPQMTAGLWDFAGTLRSVRGICEGHSTAQGGKRLKDRKGPPIQVRGVFLGEVPGRGGRVGLYAGYSSTSDVCGIPRAFREESQPRRQLTGPDMGSRAMLAPTKALGRR